MNAWLGLSGLCVTVASCCRRYFEERSKAEVKLAVNVLVKGQNILQSYTRMPFECGACTTALKKAGRLQLCRYDTRLLAGPRMLSSLRHRFTFSISHTLTLLSNGLVRHTVESEVIVKRILFCFLTLLRRMQGRGGVNLPNYSGFHNDRSRSFSNT